MANIEVSEAIDNLLQSTPSTTVTTAQALTALGAVTTSGALGTPISGTLTNATDLPIVAGTSGTLTIARGGTGATTAANARTALELGTAATTSASAYATAAQAATVANITALTGLPFQRVVNVKDFGALGDNVTNDTRAIQAAALSIGDGSGGVLYFPKGTYRVGESASSGYGAIPWAGLGYRGNTTVAGDGSNPNYSGGGQRPMLQVYDNMTICGDGIDVTFIQPLDAELAKPIINIPGCTNVRFCDMTLNGGRYRSGLRSPYYEGENEILDTKNDARNLTIERVKFVDGAHEGLDLDYTNYDIKDPTIFVRDCIFSNIGGAAIHNGSWIVIERCLFENISWNRLRDKIDGYSTGAEGGGAIDGNGEQVILRDSTFVNCANGGVAFFRNTEGYLIGQSSGSLTITANPSVSDTVTVGAQTYTFSVVAKAATSNLTTDRVTSTAHGLSANAAIQFVQVPGGAGSIAVGTQYYIRDVTTNDFKIAATIGGTALVLGQSGTGLYFVSGLMTANQVPIFTTRAETVRNLVYAINGGDNVTPRNVSATATYITPTQAASGADMLFVRAIPVGTEGNSVVFSESSSVITATGSGFLAGGGTTAESTVRIENCTFIDSSIDLFEVDDARVSGCRMEGEDTLIGCNGRNLRIQSCEITLRNNLKSYAAISLTGINATLSNSRVRGGRCAFTASGATVIGNDITSAYSSIYIHGATTHNAKIIGNMAQTTGNTVLGAAGTEAPISCATTGQTGHVVVGNRAIGATGAGTGIQLQAGSTCSGNNITSGLTSIAVAGVNNSITGNRIESGNVGISFAAAASGCTATGNVITQSGGATPLQFGNVNNLVTGNIGYLLPSQHHGTGTPETFVTAFIGSTFVNTTNGDIYRKTSGTAATGWVTP